MLLSASQLNHKDKYATSLNSNQPDIAIILIYLTIFAFYFQIAQVFPSLYRCYLGI